MKEKRDFKYWLEIYESTSAAENRRELYEGMLKTAKTFDDWDKVHKYAADRSSFEMKSLEKMKSIAVKDADTTEIIRVISFLGDYEKKDFLANVMNSHQDSESLSLLVINFLEAGDDAWNVAFYNLSDSYRESEDLERAQDVARNDILLNFLKTYHEKVDGKFVCDLMCCFPDSEAYREGWKIAEGDLV